jgi:hypothetical protein
MYTLDLKNFLNNMNFCHILDSNKELILNVVSFLKRNLHIELTFAFFTLFCLGSYIFINIFFSENKVKDMEKDMEKDIGKKKEKKKDKVKESEEKRRKRIEKERERDSLMDINDFGKYIDKLPKDKYVSEMTDQEIKDYFGDLEGHPGDASKGIDPNYPYNGPCLPPKFKFQGK